MRNFELTWEHTGAFEMQHFSHYVCDGKWIEGEMYYVCSDVFVRLFCKSYLNI